MSKCNPPNLEINGKKSYWFCDSTVSTVQAHAMCESHSCPIKTFLLSSSTLLYISFKLGSLKCLTFLGFHPPSLESLNLELVLHKFNFFPFTSLQWPTANYIFRYQNGLQTLCNPENMVWLHSIFTLKFSIS